MKTHVKLLFMMAVISLVASCDKTGDLVSDGQAELKRAQPITVTVPFEAHMLGTVTNIDPENPECDGYYCQVTVETKGTATHMGKVHTTLIFCALGPDDPNIPGEDHIFTGCQAELVAANGDKLFIEGEGGSVITGRTEDHPEYVVDYFKYKIFIRGGTGKFEGASGELQADDYDTNLNEYSVHNWYGEITLVKGKRK